MGGENDLEAEAREEWIERGYEEGEFTLKKMIEIWDNEDMAEMDESNEDRLKDKMDMIKNERVFITKEEFLRRVAALKTKVTKETKEAVQKTWKALEPSVIRERRFFKDHVANVREMDEESMMYDKMKAKIKNEFFKLKKKEKEVNNSRNMRIEKNAPQMKYLKELKHKADVEDRKKISDNMEKNRTKWRNAEIDEKKKQRSKMHELDNKLVLFKRERNELKWKKITERTATERSAMDLLIVERKNNDAQEILETYVAMEQKRKSEEAINSEDHMIVSSKQGNLGIYGIPMNRGEWASFEDGGNKVGLDEHTIGIPNSIPRFSALELKRNELNEKKSVVKKCEEDMMSYNKLAISNTEDRNTLFERKERLKNDIQQIDNEENNLLKKQAGPPRRDPTAIEIQASHSRKSRRLELVNSLNEVKHREQLLNKEFSANATAIKQTEAALNSCKKEALELEQFLDKEYQNDHSLPSIVGTSIFKKRNNRNFEANPQQSVISKNDLSIIEHKSRLELLRGASNQAVSSFKEMRDLNFDTWKLSEKKNVDEAELEISLSRLSNVKDALIDKQADSLRSDIVGAIDKFHKSDTELKKVNNKHSGDIFWWKARNIQKSVGVVPWKSKEEGIVLGEHRGGIIQGSYSLPIHSSYVIKLVLINIAVKDDPGVRLSTTNTIHIRFGTSTAALNLVGVYSALDENGELQHSQEVYYDFVGSKLTFSFEFGGNSSLLNFGSLVVLNGSFEENDKAKLGFSASGRRVLSDFVQMLRVLANQSTQKSAILMEELIKVEDSGEKTWDSKVLHGHTQRFNREDYAKQLRQAIKNEIALMIDQDVHSRVILKRQAVNTDPSCKENQPEDTHIDTNSKLNASILRHTQRKSSQNDTISSSAMSLIGRRIEVWIDNNHWQMGYIKELRIEFLDSSTTMIITHKVQLFNAEKTSFTEKWLNLKNEKFVVLGSNLTHVLSILRSNEYEKIQNEKKIAQAEELAKIANIKLSTFAMQTSTEAEEDSIFEALKRKGLEKSKADSIKKVQWQYRNNPEIKRKVEEQLVEQSNSEPLKKEAIEFARDKYVAETVEQNMKLVNRTWEKKDRRRLEKRKKERQLCKKELESDAHAVKELIESIDNSNACKKGFRSTLENDDILKIPNFNIALPPAPKCEHVKTKFWGSKYDQGILCLECHKELGKVHLEEDHTRGANPELDRDVEMHRKNEGSFRFKDSDHLRTVEEERLRLEKEAREIALAEIYSYDLEDVKVIHDINRRHLIIRKEDTNEPSVLKSHGELVRIERDRHLAAYREEIRYYTRINNFRVRISKLNEIHATLTITKRQNLKTLQEIHEESFRLNQNLIDIAQEHYRARLILDSRETVRKNFEVSRRALQKALLEKKAADQASIGVEEGACLAENQVIALKRANLEISSAHALNDVKKEFLKDSLVKCKERLETAKLNRYNLSKEILELKYRKSGTIIYTMYGKGKVLYYRSEDHFLVIRLMFCQATLHIPLCKIVQHERSREQIERKAMLAIENENSLFYNQEKVKTRQVIREMEKEQENMKLLIQWEKLKRSEIAAVTIGVLSTELQNQIVLRTPSKMKQFLTLASNEASNKAILPRLRVSLRDQKNQKNSSSSSQKFNLMRLRRACNKRLCMDFIEKQLINVEFGIQKDFSVKRDHLNKVTICENIYLEISKDIMIDVLRECITTGQIERNVLERKSLVALNLPNIQADKYYKLSKNWIRRKKEARVMLHAWRKQAAKLNETKLLMARRAEFVQRQNKLREELEAKCREMQDQEIFCRKFYHEELRLALIERRDMRVEEVAMKEFLRLEAIEIMKKKYSTYLPEEIASSNKEARRLEIKKGKQEKTRLRKEWKLIMKEDEIGFLVREKELEIRRKTELEENDMVRQLEREISSGFEDYNDISQSNEIIDSVAESISNHTPKHVKLSKQEKKRQNRLMAQQAILEKQRRDAKKKHAEFKLKIQQEYMLATVETISKVTEVEMDLIEYEEELNRLRMLKGEVFHNNELIRNAKKVKSEEESDITLAAGKRRKYATLCEQRCAQANLQVKSTTSDYARDENTKIKVLKDSETMDTSVLHNRMQRFSTDYVYKALHMRFFTTIIDIIINRSMVVVYERASMKNNESIQLNDKEVQQKTIIMSQLSRKVIRHDRMRLKKRTLSTFFTNWNKFYTRKIMVSSAFDLRYTLILQNSKINSVGEHLGKSKVTPADLESPLHRTLMQRHQSRWIECRHCKTVYSENQNHAFACSYHPGVFILACVKSCSSRCGGALTPNCMMHRAKRWTCCDNTNQGQYGNTGCLKRFHMPIKNSPYYEEKVSQLNEIENQKLSDLQSKISSINTKGLARKSRMKSMKELQKIQETLKKQRDIASRFVEY